MKVEVCRAGLLAMLLALASAVAMAGVEDLRRKAEGGDSESQWLLGDRYHQGIDVEQDHAEAARWYALAVEAGHAGAMYRLGLLRLTGQGVEPDRARAEELLVAAARAGYPRAPVALATFYLGMGAPEETDFIKAYAWLRVAERQGWLATDEAAGMRDLLESELRPEEREAAQAMADQLLGR